MAPVQGGLSAPPGVTPNFDHPDRSLQAVDYFVQAIFFSVITPIVVARLYGRAFVTRMFAAEDWICIAAWLFDAFYSISTIFLGVFGGGIHQWDVTAESLEKYNKACNPYPSRFPILISMLTLFQLVYVQVILYGPAAFFTRLTILLLIARIFEPFRRAMIFIYAFIGCMVLYYVIGIFIKIFICTPINDFWDSSVPGTCFDQPALVLVDTILSAVGDFIILLLPTTMASRLQMCIRQKLRVIAIFAVGGIACVLTIYRAVIVGGHLDDPDQTYSFMRVDLLGNAETQLGLLCASLPAMPSLIRHFRSRSTQNTSSIKSTTLRLEEFRRATQKASQGYQKTGSDQDILISSEYRNMPKVETTIQGGEETSRQSEWGPIEGRIMRTVEVTYTYPDRSNAATGS